MQTALNFQISPNGMISTHYKRDLKFSMKYELADMKSDDKPAYLDQTLTMY